MQRGSLTLVPELSSVGAGTHHSESRGGEELASSSLGSHDSGSSLKRCRDADIVELDDDDDEREWRSVWGTWQDR